MPKTTHNGHMLLGPRGGRSASSDAVPRARRGRAWSSALALALIAGLSAAGGGPAAAATSTTTAPASTGTVTTPPTTAAPSPAASTGYTGAPPNDPLYSKGPQWGLSMIGAPSAWTSSVGAGITIGVVDTGVDLTHEDLAGHIVATTNCVGSGGDPTQCRGNAQDDNGHGTHVAGIAAAVTDNGKGVAGMAPNAHLVVAKALDANGDGSLADVNAGIEWVVDHGAKVVNLSLGDANQTFTSPYHTSLQQGIEYAWSKGAVAVLASGNSALLGLGGSSQYGNLDAVVVGAVGREGTVASYSSSTGDAKWALLAPGGSADGIQQDDIVSTYWMSGRSNQYGYLAGTSMAAPFVSGTLALLLATGLSPVQAVNRVLSTVNTLVPCGVDSTNCHGLLDAAKALQGLSQVGAASTGPPSTVAKGSSGSSGPRPPATPAPGSQGAQPSNRGAPTGPAPVQAAPPAVMLPGGGAPATGGAGHGPAAPTARTPPTTQPEPAGRVLVGLASQSGHGHGGGSLGWFALLAVAFILLVVAGVVRVMRTVPDQP